jgi:hypothetical protein
VELDLTSLRLWVADVDSVPPEAVVLIRRAAFMRTWKRFDDLVAVLPRRNSDELEQLLADPDVLEEIHQAHEAMAAPLGLLSQLSRAYDEEGRRR